MRNLKLILSYAGTHFNGWHPPPACRTVQDTLEQAIAAVTGARPHANASGRTDAGGHAVGQGGNFSSDTRLTPPVLLRAINAHLPDDAVVRKASEVGQSFDANKDAL